MTRVTIPGGALFVRVDGESGRPWLVLSNSLAADHTMWDVQMPFLTRHFRVLRYDTRGHGASDAPPAPYRFADLVADVVALMDHHGIARATYIGLSLGGMTGLGLALAHPARLDAVLCCAARADAPQPFVKGWDDRLQVVEQAGTQGLVAATIERWLTPGFRVAQPEAAAKLAAQISRTSADGYRGCAAALKTLNYLKDLGRITVPTGYIAGSDDAAAPPAVMQAMADATPGGRLEVVPQAAHILNVDNQPGYDAAVQRLLRL